MKVPKGSKAHCKLCNNWKQLCGCTLDEKLNYIIEMLENPLIQVTP